MTKNPERIIKELSPFDIGRGEMTLYINTSFFPYRLSISRDRGTAMDLTIELTNRGNDAKIVSLDLQLPRTVGVDRTGMQRRVFERFDTMAAGETVKKTIPIFLSGIAQKGDLPAKLTVSEHFNDFKYVTKTYSKQLVVRVVD